MTLRENGAIAVICIGNPDRGDDGLGPAVAGRLEGNLPPSAQLIRRSGDMLSLLDDLAGKSAAICVDAAENCGAPGRIHRYSLENGSLPREASVSSSHAFQLADAIALAQALGDVLPPIFLYAVEGRSFESGCGLSPEVAAAAAVVANRVAAEAKHLVERKEGENAHA